MTSSPFIWCCVANITDALDANGLPGTRHFSPSTKLYCFPQSWGDGLERVRVLGKHRNSNHLADMVLDAKWIRNARAVKVYKPVVLEAMRADSTDSDEAMEMSSLMASHLNRKQEN